MTSYKMIIKHPLLKAIGATDDPFTLVQQHYPHVNDVMVSELIALWQTIANTYHRNTMPPTISALTGLLAGETWTCTRGLNAHTTALGEALKTFIGPVSLLSWLTYYHIQANKPLPE